MLKLTRAELNTLHWAISHAIDYQLHLAWGAERNKLKDVAAHHRKISKSYAPLMSKVVNEMQRKATRETGDK